LYKTSNIYDSVFNVIITNINLIFGLEYSLHIKELFRIRVTVTFMIMKKVSCGFCFNMCMVLVTNMQRQSITLVK
jgi:hypothetical protein